MTPHEPTDPVPLADGAAAVPRTLRVAGLLSQMGFGGSQNSAMSICNGLAARGHDVVLFCDSERTHFAIEPAGVRLVHLPACPVMPTERRNVRILNTLRILGRHGSRPFDGLIAFNPDSLTMAEAAGALGRFPVVFYALGVAGDQYLRPFRGLVVANSIETRNALAPIMRRDPERVPVIRARIPVLTLERRAHDPCPQLGAVPPDLRAIVLASRFIGHKVDMVANAVEAAGLLARRRRDVGLILAGDGPAFHEVRALADRINRNAGRTVVHLLGPVRNIAAVFARAEAVIGMGRGIWEGLALGKPGIVVGSLGFAGVVAPETVEELGYYNFAGRNVTEPVPPARLADELEHILADGAYARRLGEFSRRFILENFDARIGAAQIEEILRDEAARPVPSAGGWLRRLAAAAQMVYPLVRSTLGAALRST